MRKKVSKAGSTGPKKPFPSGRVVCDYETDGLSPHDGSRGFILGMEDEQGNVRKARVGGADWSMAKTLLQDPKIDKIAHGARFEIKHTRHLGLTPRGKWHDTMCKSVLVDEYQRHNLGDLSSKWLDDNSKGIVKQWLDEHANKIKKEARREPNYTDVPADLLEEYLEGDLDKTLRLDWKFRYTEKKYKDLYEMETELAHDLGEMEENGLHIDIPYVHSEIARLRPRSIELEREMNALAGVRFNPRSPEQLGTVMLSMGLDTGERTKGKGEGEGQMATGFDLLAELDIDSSPFLTKLVEHRGISKIVGTYLSVFNNESVDGVLHGSLWQFGREKGMVTGRISSSDPSLHTMPGGRSKNKVLNALSKIVRKAIIPPPGHSLVFWDFAQVEPRIFACYAGDETSLKELRSGVDVYETIGRRIFGVDAFNGLSPEDHKLLRFQAKTIYLALCYGMGVNKMAAKLSLPVNEAKRLKDQFFAGSPATRRFMLDSMKELLMNGVSTDRFGRDYHVPRDLAYKVTNAKIQGSAATVMKKAVLRSRALKSLGLRRLSVIHDELVGSCPTENVMEVAREGIRLLTDRDSFEIELPVTCSISDKSWGEKKEVVFK